MDEKYVLHNIIPPEYYKTYLKSKKNRFLSLFLNITTYLLICVRLLYFVTYDKINSVDTVIISRGLVPRHFPYLLQSAFESLFSKTKLIWDFDDDILYSKEISKKEFDFLSFHSTHIIVTHTYLKEQIDEKYIGKVIVVPTTDGDFRNFDINLILEERLKSFDEEIRLVWIGTAANLPFLEKSLGALKGMSVTFYENTKKKVSLYVVCSEPLFTDSFPYLAINNIEWSQQRAVDTLKISHVGIMPLDLNKYTLGKGGFKLVQYMAMGLPVIASNVGFNKEIIDKSFGELISSTTESTQWYDAIINLTSDKPTYAFKSRNSYKEWNNRFSYDENLKKWKELLPSFDFT